MHNGTPTGSGLLLDEREAQRFWTHVDFEGGTSYLTDPLATARDGECWTWSGWASTTGYGRFMLRGRGQAAHRVAFQDFGHDLGPGLEIDHLCRNRSCVNPDHLEVVDRSTNVRRSSLAIRNREFCRNGHRLTPANIARRKRGDRYIQACRTCLAAMKHRTYLRSIASSA